jgi:hypothetical protein
LLHLHPRLRHIGRSGARVPVVREQTGFEPSHGLFVIDYENLRRHDSSLFLTGAFRKWGGLFGAWAVVEDRADSLQ